jgi:hypothetical protein
VAAHRPTTSRKSPAIHFHPSFSISNVHPPQLQSLQTCQVNEVLAASFEVMLCDGAA